MRKSKWKGKCLVGITGCLLAAGLPGVLRAQRKAQPVEVAEANEAESLTPVGPVSHSSGEIRGFTVGSGGLLPIEQALVRIHSLTDEKERTVVSDAKGTFTITDMEPGRYEVSAEKPGFTSSARTTLELAPGQHAELHLFLKDAQPLRGRAQAHGIAASASSSGENNAGPSGDVASSGDAQPVPAASPAPSASSAPAASPGASDRTAAASAPKKPAIDEELDALKDRLEQLDAMKKSVEEELEALKARVDQESPAGAASDQPASGAALSAAADTAPFSSSNDIELTRRPAASAGAPQAAVAPPSAAAQPQGTVIPEGLQTPAATSGVDTTTPFAYADFTWLNGTTRNAEPIFDTNFFTPEIRFDTYYTDDFNQPIDHTMGGSSEEFRSGEFQLEQASVGGDFHWHDVRGRILTLFGMFASTTARNDASAGVGSWDVDTAYRYISEAYGGYHFNVSHGLNVDAGIFVSYIGLFSYYNFDNWAYQPSYVSSNTPWFFNGVRIQYFPTNKLKIEPWIINGWQSYNKFNSHLGLGGQVLWRPHEWLAFVFNNYGDGNDTLFNPLRSRIHTDDSFLIRFYNRPDSPGLSKFAISFTGDLGCEYGGGVSCMRPSKNGPEQAFAGWMEYNRFWFHKDRHAITIGGGMMTNPGRYLTLLPPIDGATAVTGTPYFTENPGDKAAMWDTTITYQWMPRPWATWWVEGSYRNSNVPYWTGHGGITPPGGNNSNPADYTCANGTTSGVPSSGNVTADLPAVEAVCAPLTGLAGKSSVWFPDLVKTQALVGGGIMIKF